MTAGFSIRATNAAVLVCALASLVGCASTPPTAGFTSVPAPSATAPGPGVSPSPSPRPRPSLPGADVGLRVIASGLPGPDGLVAAPDGSGRLFIVDQTGKVFILLAGAVLPQPFLDVSAKLVTLDPSYDERGLLGLAFDPDFAHSGRLFVYYTARLREGAPAGQDHTDVLSSFRVSVGDPNRVDPASEQTILAIDQPQANHDGGGLGFGSPDDYGQRGHADG